MKIKMPREQVDVSDYTDEGPICVRAITASEEAELYKLSETGTEDQTNIELASKTAIDEDGSPIFDRAEVEKLPGSMVRRIAEASLRLSGVDGEADNEKK